MTLVGAAGDVPHKVLVEGIGIGGSGESIGRTFGDNEAIDTLTDLLHRGLAARDD